jgi:hypothetical protein
MATRSTGGLNPAWRGDFGQEKGPGEFPSPCMWWRNTEPNPRPSMRLFRKALILRVLASIKWPFCIVGTLCWASLPLQ